MSGFVGTLFEGKLGRITGNISIKFLKCINIQWNPKVRDHIENIDLKFVENLLTPCHLRVHVFPASVKKK